MRSFRYVVADVFTDTPLAGNQLAVFTDARDLDELTMQRLALEIGFSETVYVLPAREGGHARIRIFTPVTELPFAGHPTLGSAFVLAAPLQLETIALETAVGVVPVQLDRDESGRIVFGRMVQPVPTVVPFEGSGELLAALGVERSELPIELYDNGVRFVYVMLATEDEVARREPRPTGAGRARPRRRERLRRRVAAAGRRGCSRPLDGVGEDAATGSAAGPLACHLARHGAIGWGDEIEISQGAEIGRPSTLYARANGSAEGIESVEVGGSAVTVARGEFRIP